MRPFNVAAYVVTWWTVLVALGVSGHPWVGLLAATALGTLAGTLVSAGRPAPVMIRRRRLAEPVRRAA